MRDAVRVAQDASHLKSAIESRLRDSLRQLIHLADQAVRDGSFNLTLRQLAQHAVRPAGTRAAAAEGDQILDAKQPTVPA